MDPVKKILEKDIEKDIRIKGHRRYYLEEYDKIMEEQS